MKRMCQFELLLVCLFFCNTVVSTAFAYTDQWQWSAKLVGYDVGPHQPSDCVQTTGTYTSKDAALSAALAACSPSVLVKPSKLTKETVTNVTTSTITYNYSLPDVQPTVGDWEYEPKVIVVVNGRPCCVGTFPDEASDYQAKASYYYAKDIIYTLDRDWTDVNYTAGQLTQNKIYRYSFPGDLPGQCGGLYQNCTFALTRLKESYCPYEYGETVDGVGHVTACPPFNYSIEITGHLLTCSTTVGDPCNVATGDQYETESDYSGPSLAFTRYYHSLTSESGHALGIGWTHNYDSKLVFSAGMPVALLRPDGHHDPVSASNGQFIALSGDGIHVQQRSTQWVAHLSNGQNEIYDSKGNLIQLVNASGLITVLNYTDGILTSIVDPFGHTLQLIHNNNLITQIIDPAGNSILYGYDSVKNLISITYQDGTSRQYLYEDPNFPHKLTGIVDESQTRFSTVTYDSFGRVASSQLAGGVDSVSLTYTDTSTTVIDAAGATTVYGFTNESNYDRRITSVSRNGMTRYYTVASPTTDIQRRRTGVVDENGNTTKYSYNTDHLYSKTEAFGTANARTTKYDYVNSESDLVTDKVVTNAVGDVVAETATTYDVSSQLPTSMTQIDHVAESENRIIHYDYYPNGQLKSVDGPRTDLNDIISFDYYNCAYGAECGHVKTITNALNHVTTYSAYDAHGRPLTITLPNGLTVTLTYDSRQRLKTRTVGSEVTSFDYWPTGLLKKLTLPDGSSINYVYDDAHRLVEVDDADGNRNVYTLDALGNRVGEKLYDANGNLSYTHTRVFNELNQLWKELNADGTDAVTTTFGYDANNNLLTVNAPLNRNTLNQYDELNRLARINGPGNNVKQYGYDAMDNVVSVTDPRNATTNYFYNGFGDLNRSVSPDTGTTSNTFDSAGNLATRTDANGNTTTFGYDELNRLTSIVTPEDSFGFYYDQYADQFGGNLARLGYASDSHGGTWFQYDQHGRLTYKEQDIDTWFSTNYYSYNAVGQLVSMRTPSYQTVEYGYTHNRITSITVNGTVILNNVSYTPSGAISGWQWGNGTQSTRTYDLDGNMTSNVSAGSSVYTYNPDGSIASQTNESSVDLRLPLGVVEFSNSATNNRLNNISGALTRSYTYDSEGDTLSDGSRTFTYNTSGRLITATIAGVTTTYSYNALGQRVKKSNINGITFFVYDLFGHELGEYDQQGNLIQEIVWLGDIPVATVRTDQSGDNVGVFYIHSDHLNAPSKITRPSDNQIIWRWDHDPYGNGTPNEDPDGNGLSLTFNLRFPGQYFDVETGLNYNMNRFYDPVTGRYLESDPIGMSGGTNTYAYVSGNPIADVDVLGLCGKSCGIKKAPEYDHNGVVPQGTYVRWDAVFLNDRDHDPKCCEVHQLIFWKTHKYGNQPPHKGFQAPENKSTYWYEDRSANGPERYGHRSGPYASQPWINDKYDGDAYFGGDRPGSYDQKGNLLYQQLPGFVESFMLTVVDVCHEDKLLYTSKTITFDFGL